MSSKPQFLILVKDFPGTIEKRKEVRAKHLEGATANSILKVGGAFFTKEPTPEDPLPFAGSVLIAEAGSKEELIATLKQDIYYKTGVWDVDGAEIIPMKVAFARM